jgi:hypothetical protein
VNNSKATAGEPETAFAELLRWHKQQADMSMASQGTAEK